MSDFATSTFERIQDRVTAMEDFGPAPLYAAIGMLIQSGNPDMANAALVEAASIHGAEDFIVEGRTTNNEVLLEVFRRLAFRPLSETSHMDVDTRRKVVSFVGTFLTQFLDALEYNNGKILFVAEDEAANDGQA